MLSGGLSMSLTFHPDLYLEGGLRGWGLYSKSLVCCRTGFHCPRWTTIAGWALRTWKFLYCSGMWMPCLRMLGRRVSSREPGGGGCITTRFRELSGFWDSLGVIGEGGSGDLKVVRVGPSTRRVTAPRTYSDARVGGNRACSACLWNGAGVYGGAGGRMRQCFRPGVRFTISMSGTGGAGVLGRRGAPSIALPMRTGVSGVPSTGSSMCTGVAAGGGGGSSGSSGGSWYGTSNGGGILVLWRRVAYQHMPP